MPACWFLDAFEHSDRRRHGLRVERQGTRHGTERGSLLRGRLLRHHRAARQRHGVPDSERGGVGGKGPVVAMSANGCLAATHPRAYCFADSRGEHPPTSSLSSCSASFDEVLGDMPQTADGKLMAVPAMARFGKKRLRRRARARALQSEAAQRDAEPSPARRTVFLQRQFPRRSGSERGRPSLVGGLLSLTRGTIELLLSFFSHGRRILACLLRRARPLLLFAEEAAHRPHPGGAAVSRNHLASLRAPRHLLPQFLRSALSWYKRRRGRRTQADRRAVAINVPMPDPLYRKYVARAVLIQHERAGSVSRHAVHPRDLAERYGEGKAPATAGLVPVPAERSHG